MCYLQEELCGKRARKEGKDMRFGLVVSAIATVVFITASRAEEASMEHVFDFPEVYAGDVVEFDKAELSSDIKKDKEYFCLEVTSQGGEKVAPALKRPGITFIASGDLVKHLLETMQLDQVYPVRLRCRIEKKDILGNTYFLANVEEVGFYGTSDKIVETVAAEGAVTETGGPEGEVVEKTPEGVVEAVKPEASSTGKNK